MSELYKETLASVYFNRPRVNIKFSRVWDADRLLMAREVLDSPVSDEVKLSRLGGIFGPLAHSIDVVEYELKDIEE